MMYFEVFISGSGSGIGKATAIAFAKEGAKVIINGSNEQKVKQAAQELLHLNYSAETFVGDIADDRVCEELKEFLLKESASEMKHVTEFSDLIFGLGGKPTTSSSDFTKFEDPIEIFQYALQMEEEVINNYVLRIKQSYALGPVDGKWLEIFLEKQIEHSREDVDHFKRMLAGL